MTVGRPFPAIAVYNGRSNIARYFPASCRKHDILQGGQDVLTTADMLMSNTKDYKIKNYGQLRCQQRIDGESVFDVKGRSMSDTASACIID